MKSRNNARHPIPFDTIAVDYDSAFSRTWLGGELRRRVQKRLDSAFSAGDQVLELNCGTGEDTLYLARRGVRVTATDRSPEMLARTRYKLGREWDLVELASLDMNSLPRPQAHRFDGVLSNFGGLNCVADHSPLVDFLSATVRTGGRLVLVLLNRICGWEIFHYLLQLQPRVAFRRFHSEPQATVGEVPVPLFYPSLRKLRRQLSPCFQITRIQGLGVALPPSYAAHVTDDRPRLRRFLTSLEDRLSNRGPFRQLGDHCIIECVRTAVPASNHDCLL